MGFFSSHCPFFSHGIVTSYTICLRTLQIGIYIVEKNIKRFFNTLSHVQKGIGKCLYQLALFWVDVTHRVIRSIDYKTNVFGMGRNVIWFGLFQ